MVRVRVRVRVAITRLPEIKNRKVDVKGVEERNERIGRWWIESMEKYGFYWWYASTCAR